MKHFIIAVAFLAATCTTSSGQDKDQIASDEYSKALAAIQKEAEAGRLTEADTRRIHAELRQRFGVRDADEVARSKREFRSALQVMVTKDKLSDKQSNEMFDLVFLESEAEWEPEYQAYLEENPGVAKAVESGKISKESVIAGIKSRDEERAPTEEEQIEALYQQMLREHPDLGRTTKEELIPRLKFMIAEGQGVNQRLEMTFKEHQMNFGRYCGNLIWGLNQVEIDDKDLKRVHDMGVAEIRRQAVDAAEPNQ